MDRKLILKAGMHKYFKAELPTKQTSDKNASFNDLLTYIGTYKKYGNRNEIGSAYCAIREKTDELLKLGGYQKIMKTSKKEVSSIRYYYSRNRMDPTKGAKYVKIPFKIAYIFKAIDDIICEMHKAGCETPSNLMRFSHLSYLNSFYYLHVEAYDNCKNDIPIDKVVQRALNDDFHGAFSPLHNKFI